MKCDIGRPVLITGFWRFNILLWLFTGNGTMENEVDIKNTGVCMCTARSFKI